LSPSSNCFPYDGWVFVLAISSGKIPFSAMEPPEEHIHARSTGAIAALEELHRNSHRCKDRHFFAAARKQNYHRWCGIPTILINSFIAYVLIRLEVLGVAGSTALLPMSTLVILTIFLGFI